MSKETERLNAIAREAGFDSYGKYEVQTQKLIQKLFEMIQKPGTHIPKKQQVSSLEELF